MLKSLCPSRIRRQGAAQRSLGVRGDREPAAAAPRGRRGTSTSLSHHTHRGQWVGTFCGTTRSATRRAVTTADSSACP